MLQKSRGIVLHRTHYSETSLILKIYSELSGMRSFMAKGVRKKHSRIRAALFHDLSVLDLVYYDREKSEILLIKEAQPAYHFMSVPFDVRKGAVAMFLGEVLYKSIREPESNPELFSFLFHSLQWLDLASEPCGNFHLVFMVQLSRHLGFFPKNNYSEENQVFNMMEGEFQPHPPPHPHYLAGGQAILFSELIKTGYQESGVLQIKLSERREILDRLTEYFRLHVEGFGAVRSHQVLHEVLS